MQKREKFQKRSLVEDIYAMPSSSFCMIWENFSLILCLSVCRCLGEQLIYNDMSDHGYCVHDLCADLVHNT